MTPEAAFQKLLLLVPALLNNQTSIPTEETSHEWTYESDWTIDYPQCAGYRQSPIHIFTPAAIKLPMEPLYFENYNVPFGPVTLVNNGHSINIDVLATGRKPAILGGDLVGRYEAVGIHFHWGSPGSTGSEHVINGERYDVEMHIVHKSKRYATVDEAIQHPDGLAVLGIMFRMSSDPNHYPGLNRIFNQLPTVADYSSTVTIPSLALSQLLGDLNRQEFFTYPGSLTTPPCSEAVTWFVFPDALPISPRQIQKFWTIFDKYNDALVDNYREVQPKYGRVVVHRVK